MAEVDDLRQLTSYIKTYRYLRIGLVVVAALLVSSILREVYRGPNCWLGSISAYYHTPVRAVFVGALLATGFGLILYRAAHDDEDILLNLAGMLAPVVALIPTGVDDLCVAKSPLDLNGRASDQETVIALRELADEAIRNNILALLIVGTISVVLALALGVRARRETGAVAGVGLAVVAVVLVAGWALFSFQMDLLMDHGHLAAAVTMFSLLALVSIRMAFRRRRARYKVMYFGVAGAMVGSPLVLYPIARSLGERPRYLLWVELAEIGCFFVYWLTQTIETWGEVRRARSAVCIIGGRVIDQTGRPVAQAGVQLRGLGTEGGDMATVTTDGAGHFEVPTELPEYQPAPN